MDPTTTAVPMHWAVPAGDGPFPGLLLFHEAFGVNDHIAQVAGRLAAQGYLVGAPSLFARLGVDTVDYADHDDAVALLSRLTNHDVLADAASAWAQLAERPDVDRDRIGALGFCFGGRCAFLAATELDLAAAASFYGPGIAAPGPEGPLARAERLRAPVLFVFGGLDPLIPDAARERIGAELDRHGKPFELVTFPLAGHAFFNDARADRHDPEAAAVAWERLLAFLAGHLGPR